MRILFLSENFPPETNAAATRVFERACYWAKWGHEVTILTCAPNFPQGTVYPDYTNKWRQVEEINGIRVVRVKTFISANEGFLLRTLDFLSFMFTAFFAGLFEKKPDVIAATSPQFFAAVCGWALGLVRRVPFLFELGDLWPASIVAVGAMKKSLIIRLLEKFELFLYRQSAGVMALTQAFKADLIRREINPEKIAVVINGVDLPRYAPRPKDAELLKEWGLENKFVIGYVGTHGMAHGLINVVNTACLLKDNPNIKFLLVGAGAEREMLIAEAQKNGLNNIHFETSKPKDMMPRIWSLCDMALVHLKNSPTFAEVIPSKIFEAMGMGLPILLVAPQGEATAIIDADKAGICLPAENPEIFAQTLTNLAQDPAKVKELAAQSLNAAPRHSREYQAESSLNVLEAVRNRKPIGHIQC